MCRIITDEDFRKDREYAKFHKCDPAAGHIRKNLTWRDRVKLRFGAVKVGYVDFGEWPEGDKRHGLPRRLPLYLFCHDDHVSVDYAHGFPGENERMTCHCGRNHYFASTRFRALYTLGVYARHMIVGSRA